MKITIDANFDPESQEDLDWITGEMFKILEEVPEIKILEEKLNLSKNITSPLDAVIEHLENATSIVGMAKKKQADAKKGNATKGDAENGTNSTTKKKTDNATVKKGADAAPAKEGAAKTEEKKADAPKADAKAEEKPKAAQVSKPSAIVDAQSTVVTITKGWTMFRYFI